MHHHANSIAPIAALVGRRLAASLHFLRKKPEQSQSGIEDDLWLSVTSSAFAEDDPLPVAAAEDEYEEYDEVCTLTEAEIYVIFGRKNDAEQVLSSAVRAGRLTTDAVARFWGGMEMER